MPTKWQTLKPQDCRSGFFSKAGGPQRKISAACYSCIFNRLNILNFPTFAPPKANRFNSGFAN